MVKVIISEQFERKPKLIPPNYQALQLGIDYVKENYEYPLGIRLERRDSVGDHILIDGNTAVALGAIYAGATVAAWYPITPSTSVVNAFESYAKKLRVDEETGKREFCVLKHQPPGVASISARLVSLITPHAELHAQALLILHNHHRAVEAAFLVNDSASGRACKRKAQQT